VIESPLEYSERLSSYVRGQDHLKVLQTSPAKIARLLRGKSSSFLRKSSQPGKWSIADILAHLAESDLVVGYRFRLMVSSSGTPIQSFDQDAWQSHAGYLRRDPKAALRMFREIRISNVAFLKSLTKEQWNRFGMHSERGQESVMRLTELTAGHDINHLRQIESIVKARKKPKAGR